MEFLSNSTNTTPLPRMCLSRVSGDATGVGTGEVHPVGTRSGERMSGAVIRRKVLHSAHHRTLHGKIMPTAVTLPLRCTYYILLCNDANAMPFMTQGTKFRFHHPIFLTEPPAKRDTPSYRVLPIRSSGIDNDSKNANLLVISPLVCVGIGAVMAEIHKSGAKPQASLAAHAGIGVSHGLTVPWELASNPSFEQYTSGAKVLWPRGFHMARTRL